MASSETELTHSQKYKKTKQIWITFFSGLGVVIIALIITFGFIIGVSSVDGHSMDPTMTDGQNVVFYRREASYDRGEIVSIHMPSGDNYVKRVIAIEGDTIDIRDGDVYLNEELLKENYIQGVTKPQSDLIDYPFIVGENRIFVMGDNREGSVDSRSFGEVSVKSVLGKILGAE